MLSSHTALSGGSALSTALERLRDALADRYRVERELGRGGMATVYLAEDLKHRRQVAIKVIHPEMAAAIGHDRFLREIEIAARLTHPHILSVHDSGEADGLLYYVMPYAEGESLRERLAREKQLPLEDVLRITHEVADAIDYAHRHDVIHRDIKPENILLMGRHAMVADFGIARAFGTAGGAQLTTAGVMVGTPLYMSPEQSLGDPSMDGRSDLYALGCVVYEMLAGEPPFTGPTAEVVRHQHLNSQPPAVTALRPTVPAEMTRALSRALAKLPADRFATAPQFAEALALPTRRASPTALARTRRRPTLVVSAILAVIVTVVLVVWKTGFQLPLPSHGPRETAKKDLILVAEFEGPPDDPGLAAAARDLVSAALDQSGIVATVPTEQIRIALHDAGKPESTWVNADLARELAYRRSIRSVLEGRISRLGTGFSTVLRVVDPDGGGLVLSVNDAASGEVDLIPSLERVARKLRVGLGERTSAVRATRPLIQAMTPSFAAYRKYLKAVELKDDGDFRGSIRLHREALALDPNFAAAWGGLGVAYGNLGAEDSSTVFFAEALRHLDRLTEAQRFGLEATLAMGKGDLTTALSLQDRYLQENITPAQAASLHHSRAIVLARLGRYEEALVSLQRSRALWPFGPPKNPNISGMEFRILLASGHLPAARTVAEQMEGARKLDAEVRLALPLGNWATAESLGTLFANDQTAGLAARTEGTLVLAASMVARGAIESAAAELQQAQATAEAAGDTGIVDLVWWRRLMMAVTGATAVPPLPRILRGNATLALLDQGMWAAASGDTALARRNLLLIRSQSKKPFVLTNALLLEGWIAVREGRSDEAVRVLRPATRAVDRLDEAAAGEVHMLMRWHLATAYEQLGNLDSAATSLELVISPLRGYGDPITSRGILFSLAHRRLVLLYARLGRLEDAKRHWATFSSTFTSPDPEMLPLISEARMSLAAAANAPNSARR